MSREDFLLRYKTYQGSLKKCHLCLRFVYYETLVTTLKQLGVKNDIVDFEQLKKEKQKQTLYGLLETASILGSGSTLNI